MHRISAVLCVLATLIHLGDAKVAVTLYAGEACVVALRVAIVLQLGM